MDERTRESRERWEGRVDQELQTIRATIISIEIVAREMQDDVHSIDLKVQTLATKFLFVVGIGTLVGGGIVSGMIGLLFKH